MLKFPATLMLTSYEPIDGGSIALTFECSDPGGGEPSNWIIQITDTELADAADIKVLIAEKLQRKFRSKDISSRLDPLIGLKVTI